MDKPWKVITAFIGIFVAGAIFGGFFTLGIGWRVIRHNAMPGLSGSPSVPAAPVVTAAPAPAPSTPAPTASSSTPVASNPAPKKAIQQAAVAALPTPQAITEAQLLRRLTERLNLTAAQRERIMPLIQRAVEDFRRQQNNYLREDQYILQRLQQDISKVLSPEQRERLEDLEEKQREFMRRRQAEAQALQKSGASSSTSTPPAAKPGAPSSEVKLEPVNPAPKPSGGAAGTAATPESSSTDTTAGTTSTTSGKSTPSTATTPKP